MLGCIWLTTGSYKTTENTEGTEIRKKSTTCPP
jgi:hypothetical protein